MREFIFKLLPGCMVAMLAACGDAGETGHQAGVFEDPQMVATMPAVAESRVGGHRIRARVDQCNPEEKDAQSCGHSKDCFYGDALALTIWRGESILYRFGYCSAYANAWLRIYGDTRGDPYVFVGYSDGRGPRATGHAAMVFSFPREGAAVNRLSPLADPLTDGIFAEHLDESWRPMVGAFITMMPVDEHENLTYVYKVEAAKDAGLNVELKAVSCPDPSADTCQGQPKSVRMSVRR